MKSALRIVSVSLAVGTVSLWLATGANRGWTRTSVAIEKTDEVTGLSYREYQRRFLPGLDLLSAGILLSALAAAAAALWPRGPRSVQS